MRRMYNRLINSDEASTSEVKQAEIVFYREVQDESIFQKLVVEKNLCSSDLCQVLALKSHVEKSIHWTIWENWGEYNVERVLEDHEDVLGAYLDTKGYKKARFKFVFRKDHRRFEFFERPYSYFPSELIDVEAEDPNMNPTLIQVQNLATMDGLAPRLFSEIWYRHDKKGWYKSYLFLRDQKVFIFDKINMLRRYNRVPMDKFNQMVANAIAKRDPEVQVIASLRHVYIYEAPNAKNQLKAPVPWGIVLRPTSKPVETTAEEEKPTLRCLACDCIRIRDCWVTAMRLAKYGRQLRDNYRAFKNKQAESINPKDYQTYLVLNVSESVRSRVAMDFTGSVGRIVEDPEEANAIAVAEGYSWERRWKEIRGNVPRSIESGGGIHVMQPWFHSGMNRDQATTLVSKHGPGVDGVFLVRESRSKVGAFVLTYKCGGRIIHAQMNLVQDPIFDGLVYSIDNGATKFYDMLQLIEFYQLNAGCLPTRLTHYVTHNAARLEAETNWSVNSSRTTPGNESPEAGSASESA